MAFLAGVCLTFGSRCTYLIHNYLGRQMASLTLYASWADRARSCTKTVPTTLTCTNCFAFSSPVRSSYVDAWGFVPGYHAGLGQGQTDPTKKPSVPGGTDG